jgi:hypothetical protein
MWALPLQGIPEKGIQESLLPGGRDWSGHDGTARGLGARSNIDYHTVITRLIVADGVEEVKSLFACLFAYG